MINSFLDLVRESQEVDEMGVQNVAKLSQSTLGKLGSFGQTFKKLRNLLKAVKSSDIVMEKPTASRTYYPRFRNQEIIEVMRALQNEDSRKFSNLVGKWYDLEGSGIRMETDAPSSFQRSHFPNDGIPEGIRGLGLGSKLYRALLRKVGYISSNTSATTEASTAWASIISKKDNEDDAYAIVGPSNWIAFDKSMDQNEIIRIATKFLDEKIGFNSTTPTQFDMDDELLSFMPEDILSNLREEYLDSLVADGRITQEKKDSIVAAKARAAALARQRADEEARLARERAAEAEREQREEHANQLRRFGVTDPDADWDVGDFVVLKEYLFNGWDPLPIREVAGFHNNQYYALGISEMIRVRNNEIQFNNASDTRTTRDKSKWFKVDINAIPDLDNVNLNPAEKQYIIDRLSPETRSRFDKDLEAQRTQRREEETGQNVTRASNPETFGFVPESGQRLKEALQGRPNSANINLLKKFKARNFYERSQYVVMGPPQLHAMRQNFGIPVFIPWVGSGRSPRPASIDDIQEGRAMLTNAVTGVHLERPYGGLDLRIYPLSEVTVADKIRARHGEHFYIAGHQNTYGLVAKSEYGTKNTRDQKFIYLKVYGYAGRSVSVRLDLLRKIGAPITI